MKRFVSLFLVLLILCSMLPLATISTAAATTSGSCGTNAKWSFDSSTGTLTISGSGKMKDYDYLSQTPWYKYKANLTKVVIKSGITSIGDSSLYLSNLTSISIANTVKTIGDRAFSNTDITSITIPNSVTTIKSSAFSECYKLSSLYIPASVSSIGAGAFAINNLTKITVASGNKYYNSRNNCNAIIETATNTLIQACKNTIIPNGVKIIASGAFNSINIAKVTIPDSVTTLEPTSFSMCSMKSLHIGSGVKYINTDPFLSTFRSCYNLENITVSSSNYRYDSRSNCNALIDTATNKLLLGTSKSTIPYGVKTIGISAFEGVDFSNTTKPYIPTTVTSIEDTAFGYTANISEIEIPKSVTYIGDQALYGSYKKVIIYSPNCTFANSKYVISDYTTIYGYNNSTAQAYAKKYGRKFVSIGSAPPAYYSTPLAVPKTENKITATTQNEKKEIEVSFGNKFGIEVPKDVPFLGGQKIEFDMSFVPISATVTGNTLRVGIGCENDLLEKGDLEEWGNFKKYVENYRDKYQDGKKWLSEKSSTGFKAGFKEAFDLKVFGYLEQNLDDNLSAKSGLINIVISGGVKGEWQLMVVSVPVVIKASAKAAVNANIGAVYDIENNEIDFLSNLTITIPDLKLSAGIGVANIADVSVYGQLKNDLGLYFTPQKYFTGTIYGEAGVSVKALFFEFSQPIIDNGDDGWVYFDTRKKSVASLSANISDNININEDQFEINRTYADTQTLWLQSQLSGKTDLAMIGTDGTTNTDFVTLQSSVYPNALPQLLKTDDTTMMVWASDITTRTVGNHTAIVYSVYNKDTNTWSIPVMVEDDGTADFNPSVATDGNDIYVAYVDANTIFDGDVDLSTMASSCEISVAKYDAENAVFAEVSSLTNNTVVDSYPNVSVTDGKATVVWKSNSENNVINFSGIDTIHYATQDDDGIFTTQSYLESDKLIYNIVTDGQNIAYTADTDGSIDINTDTEIFAGNINSAPTQITSNDVMESGLSYSNINNSALLTYLNDGVIYSYSNGTTTALTDENYAILGEYQFVTSEDKTVLLSVSTENNASKLYKYSLNSASLWSNPISLVESTTYLKGVSSIIDDSGNIQTAHLNTFADITEDSVTEICDLCTTIVSDTHDIVLNGLDYSQEDVVPGENLQIKANITNNGTRTENSYRISITDDSDKSILSTVVDKQLASGESTDVEVSITLPEKITKMHSYNFSITPTSGTDMNNSNNQADFYFGYSDLSLQSDVLATGNAQGVLLNITNKSAVATNTKLIVKKDNNNGDIINEYELGLIEGEESAQYLLDKTVIARLKEKSENLYLEIISENLEIAIADNFSCADISDISVSKIGDVDGDGVISITDATQIQMHLAELVTLSKDQLYVAKVSNAEYVSILDATYIQQYLAEIICTL